MITLVEALNYRCLRYVQRPLNPFHVLVGPNASGKTTFLDVIGFLSDLVSEGLDAALSARASNPEELLFRQQGDGLELAVEARIPDTLRELTSKPELDTVRYEVAIGFDETQRQFEFKAETLLLKKAKVLRPSQRSLFPTSPSAPDSLHWSSEVRTQQPRNQVPQFSNQSFGLFAERLKSALGCFASASRRSGTTSRLDLTPANCPSRSGGHYNL